MKKSLSIVLIAVLAFGIGIAYAAPMLVVPVNIQPFPQVVEGSKADFDVDVVYAKFDRSYQKIMGSDPAIKYTVVFNVTNLSDKAATLYELSFAAAQDVSVQQSILGGSIYDNGLHANNRYKNFGGIVDGVYLDGKWVNITWIPNIYYHDINGTTLQAQYPLCLYFIAKASWNNATIYGPLTPDEVISFSADHAINGTIPDLPVNASGTGIWFEGVPITEYYDSSGNPIITEMYINGAWVDVTGRVTVDETQPMMTTSNMLLNQVLRIGSVYQNMNSTVGQVTTLPTWGDWDVGTVNYVWLPWEQANQQFNPTFAPHESKLIAIYGTQTPSSLSALESGNIQTYTSASNYLTNWPVNGTYYNTVSTTTQIKQIEFQQTQTRYQTEYLYNAILSGNQTFQPGNSYLSNHLAEDRTVTNNNTEALEGNTLNVYAYIVKEGKSVGPREVMRATGLTSPSVAHWHLQKLEGLGLLAKTEYGEYTVKEKVNISGHLWVGRTLVPRLIFYSFFFMGILIMELGVIAYPLFVQGQALNMYLFYLISPTAIAMVLFLIEGLWLTKKTKRAAAKPVEKKA